MNRCHSEAGSSYLPQDIGLSWTCKKSCPGIERSLVRCRTVAFPSDVMLHSFNDTFVVAMQVLQSARSSLSFPFKFNICNSCSFAFWADPSALVNLSVPPISAVLKFSDSDLQWNFYGMLSKTNNKQCWFVGSFNYHLTNFHDSRQYLHVHWMLITRCAKKHTEGVNSSVHS